MDDKTREQLLKWYEECESDVEMDNNSDSDAPSGHSEHCSDTEQSGLSEGWEIIECEPVPSTSASNITILPIDVPISRGKDKTEWLHHKRTDLRTKTSRQNIITKLPGVKNVAKQYKTALDCWKLFFPDEIISHIVDCTNQKLDKMRPSYNNSKNCAPTDFIEISAFLGLLYLAGVKKAQHLNTAELWSTDGTAPDFFAATLSKYRYHILVQAIRFDDSNSRKERAKFDNLSPIRHIFDAFVQQCLNNYTISEYATIDEMLEAFRGRCKFRQYIANKPAKYGIKIYALCDARMFYTSNMEIYAGRQPDGPFQKPNDASSVVKRLIQPIDNSGRNVTMDNYFTSVPLANDLYENHRLTIVGTIRKNKAQIPPMLLDVKNRPIKSSIFLYGDKEGNTKNHCILASYVPKKNKNVLMLSTLHDDDSIDPSSQDLKPEVITFYNSTKGGVDVVDRLKSEYSVSRISNRWPLTVFCTLLNIATVNSQIIFRSNTNVILKRRAFITDLAKQLALPHVTRRASIPRLSTSLRQKIHNVAGIKPQPAPSTANNEKPRCLYCPVRKNRFTQHRCNICTSPICKEHTQRTSYTCTECTDDDNDEN